MQHPLVRVPEEQLIPAISGQGDRDPFAREPGQQYGSDHGRIGERLVQEIPSEQLTVDGVTPGSWRLATQAGGGPELFVVHYGEVIVDDVRFE